LKPEIRYIAFKIESFDKGTQTLCHTTSAQKKDTESKNKSYDHMTKHG